MSKHNNKIIRTCFIKTSNKMSFILRRSSPYVLALLPVKLSDNNDTPDPKTIQARIKRKEIPNETGRDRLKRMFSKDEYGELSPEIRYCIHLSSMAVIVGAFYGGIIRGRSAFIHFIDTNEATMFRNHLDAKRQLQDTVSMSLAKGAAQWGWRAGLFTSIYACTSTVIAVLRGKSGILEHVDGGLIAGAIYNLKNGIRGAIVGGALGGVLGGIFGTIFYGFLVISGQTMEELQFWTYEWHKHREDLYTEGDKKRRIMKDEEAIMKITEELTEPEMKAVTMNKK